MFWCGAVRLGRVGCGTAWRGLVWGNIETAGDLGGYAGGFARSICECIDERGSGQAGVGRLE